MANGVDLGSHQTTKSFEKDREEIFQSNKEVNLKEIMNTSDEEYDGNKSNDLKSSQDTDVKVQKIVTKILSRAQESSSLTESDYVALKLQQMDPKGISESHNSSLIGPSTVQKMLPVINRGIPNRTVSLSRHSRAGSQMVRDSLCS